MDIILAEKKTIQPGVVTYQWTTPEPVAWRAGQYGVFYLEHSNWDIRGPERKFTISAPPREELAFTARSSNSSFKKALENLKAGQAINLKNIGGEFIIDDQDLSRPLTFIAGGIGITPFHAILSDMAQGSMRRPTQLLYINSNKDFIFENKLDHLTNQNPDISIQYLIGRNSLSADILKRIPALHDSKVMVSGPTPFLDYVEERLIQAGVDDNLIQYDDFEEDWPV